MTTSLRAHRPGIDQQVPLEEMKRAGHGHSTGAQIVLTDRCSTTGQVKVLAPGNRHAEDRSAASLIGFMSRAINAISVRAQREPAWPSNPPPSRIAVAGFGSAEGLVSSRSG